MKELEKEEDRKFAQEFKHKVEADDQHHNQLIEGKRSKINALLDTQSNTVIVDANDLRKRDAVNNMKQAYERAQ